MCLGVASSRSLGREGRMWAVLPPVCACALARRLPALSVGRYPLASRLAEGPRPGPGEALEMQRPEGSSTTPSAPAAAASSSSSGGAPPQPPRLSLRPLEVPAHRPCAWVSTSSMPGSSGAAGDRSASSSGCPGLSRSCRAPPGKDRAGGGVLLAASCSRRELEMQWYLDS